MNYERLTNKGKRMTDEYANAFKFREWTDGETVINFIAFKDTYNRLAELEDKIEDGRLVELPCKIGTLVYVIYTNGETGELDVRITDVVGYEIMRGEIWAKTSIPYRKCYIEIENVFRTRAEAEAKLKELRGEE